MRSGQTELPRSWDHPIYDVWHLSFVCGELCVWSMNVDDDDVAALELVPEMAREKRYLFVVFAHNLLHRAKVTVILRALVSRSNSSNAHVFAYSKEEEEKKKSANQTFISKFMPNEKQKTN